MHRGRLPRTLLLILLVTLPPAYCKETARVARVRVDQMLDGLQKDGGSNSGYMQASAVQWCGDRAVLGDQDALARADADFRKWLIEKDLHRKISSYEILKVDAEDSTTLAAVRVKFRVEGKEYNVRVPHQAAMTWIN